MMTKSTVSLFLTAALPLFGSEVRLSSSSLTAVLNGDDKGSVSRLMMKDGHDFIAAKSDTPLFSLQLTRETNFTDTVWISAKDAASCTAESVKGGIRLIYGRIGSVIEKAICTVKAHPGDPELRWRLAVFPAPGWKVERINFPQMTLTTGMDGTAEQEVLVGGHAKGGLLRNPGAAPIDQTLFYGQQPGELAAQFVTYYDDRRLFYFGSEDSKGRAKALSVKRVENGLFFNGSVWTWSSDGKTAEFDFVTSAMTGSENRPCSWYDAADHYRKWALKQPWCAKTLINRTDLPGWMKDAPIMARFYRGDFLDTNRIRTWIRDFWLKEFPDTPLVVAMWGWEPQGEWVSDYFPCLPSDEEFRSLTSYLKDNRAHAFVWPSGYHWTKMYGVEKDGTFRYDARDRFQREIAQHAAVLRDGTVHDRDPGWLGSGHLASLCPGDPWTFSWWRDDVCRELARRGCELIQADQICGGYFQDCWSRNHPHPPGNGQWKTEIFRRQLAEMRKAMKTAVKDAVVGFEEPNEIYNDLIGIQDYRDCNLKGEWAGVFNYLYHDFVPCFQSNVFGGENRHWYAYMAVEGQIPFFGNPGPDDARSDRPVFENGDFEIFSEARQAFDRWEAYSGTHHPDREVKHGGAMSLRIETKGPEERQQISRNVALNPETFTPGKTYRISAWLKTECKGAGTDIRYGLFRPGFGSSAADGYLTFPSPNEGWSRREHTFTMPDEKNLTLRIMIGAGCGDTKVWVDDVRIDELSANGDAREVRITKRDWRKRFMCEWIKLYRGKGKPFLAHGRRIRPPRMQCNVDAGGLPAVHHAAYVDRNGKTAVFFANGTDDPQTFKYERPDGTWRELTIEPGRILPLYRQNP